MNALATYVLATVNKIKRIHAAKYYLFITVKQTRQMFTFKQSTGDNKSWEMDLTLDATIT